MKENDSEKVVVYTPRQREEMGWFETWLVLYRNIGTAKEMIWQLFRRDFLRPYRKSFIGIGWIVVSPLLGIISWVFMAFSGVLKPGDLGIPYPIYVLMGSSFWGLFMAFYGAGTGILSEGGGIILQVNYPHDALLVKTTAMALANFSVVFVLYLVIFTIAGYPPNWKTIMLPLAILPLFFAGTALGLVMGVLQVVIPDLGRISGVIFGILFFITPIAYSAKTESTIVNLAIKWNPLTYLIAGPRDLVLFGHITHWHVLLLLSVPLLFLFLVSWRLFFISEHKVVERM
jgi:lipopolysaccharide transport system permease protein